MHATYRIGRFISYVVQLGVGGKEPLKGGHNAIMVLRDAETIGFFQRWTLPHTFPLKLTGGDGDET